MQPEEEIRANWERTIAAATDLDRLKKWADSSDDGLDGDTSGLRSLCWKIFLQFQSADQGVWRTSTRDSRDAYQATKDHFLRYVLHPEELGAADPLNDNENSPWNALRRDEELRAVIEQDCIRCMPDEPFFRRNDTQRILLDILFVWCKMNPDTSYRQGMHELLAPIILVVEQDSLKSSPKAQSGGSLMDDILDEEFIEHDSFTLFSLNMRTAKSFYEMGDNSGREDLMPNHSNSSSIVERSKLIHEKLLARYDPELAEHLTRNEILPQIFLIRWIRLLFGREFALNDVLKLWDKLFAEDPDLELVDMICVAMLIRIRWELLEADHSSCLMLLLKYPAPTDPQGPRAFVDDAIYLRGNPTHAAASELIYRYTGRKPSVVIGSRPATPAGRNAAAYPTASWSRRGSPLPSPARFLQQQGGVEAILQGAAKGVYERTERLGINQAVRDAVAEAKRNMQNRPSFNGSLPRPQSAQRWNSRTSVPGAFPESEPQPSDLSGRNSRLAIILSEALMDISAYQNSCPDSSGSLDLKQAIKKITEVRNCLLPQHKSDSSANAEPTAYPLTTPPAAPKETGRFSPAETGSEPSPPVAETVDKSSISVPSFGPLTHCNPDTRRPATIMPTRSSIAQSSFAWMLDPNESTGSSTDPLSPGSSPFLSSSHQPTRVSNREKSAFLFGDGPAEDILEARSSTKRGTDERNISMQSIKKALGE